MEKSRSNSSLTAKSNARMAAVQLLYRAAMNNEPLQPEKLLALYASYIDENKAFAKEAALPHVPANKAYLRKLLEGVTQSYDALNTLINERLGDEWKRERMGHLLLSILTLGAYELDAYRNLSTAVLLNEYTALAQQFCDANEIGFVHGILAKIAQDLRSEHERIQPD